MLKITKNIEEANLITHASKFHADEVFATAFLARFIDNPVVCRVNVVPDNIRDDQIVYDIGFGKFDHHMKDFNERHGSGVKYAAFGLIFREYGMKYLESIDLNSAPIAFNMIEHEVVECVDAIDNGEFPEINTPYTYKALDGIIADYNACWDEDVDNDNNFMEAFNFAYTYLDKVIKRTYAKIRARSEVETAIGESKDHIMYLDKYMPFKDIVVASSNPKALDIYFAITPSNRGGYNIHTIPINKNTHETRMDFPAEWGGLADSELQKVSGVKTATFCHSGLFLAACDTIEDAYLMARLAIEHNN